VITLHDVYERGGEDVQAAVRAFGARHPLDYATEPDWKTAERHFTSLIETIMGAASPPQHSPAETVLRAQNEAIGFLLAVSVLPDYRCPICVLRRGPDEGPPPTLEAW
jgi:hypothetical protein